MSPVLAIVAAFFISVLLLAWEAGVWAGQNISAGNHFGYFVLAGEALGVLSIIGMLMLRDADKAKEK